MDLVERLENRADTSVTYSIPHYDAALDREAAAEITSLKAEVERLKDISASDDKRLDSAASRISTSGVNEWGCDAAEAMADKILGLRAKLATKEAIIDKLPKTADGVPVVPGMELHTPDGGIVTACWVSEKSAAFLDGVAILDNWRVDNLYSTPEAAKAAKEAADA